MSSKQLHTLDLSMTYNLAGTFVRPVVVAFKVESTRASVLINGQKVPFDNILYDTWYGYSQSRQAYVCPHKGL